MKAKRMVIAIDQSYTRSGISVCINGKLKLVTSTNFEGLKSPSEKRKHLGDIIDRLLLKASQKGYEVVIFVERIRTFSNFGNKGKGNAFGQGLKPDYIKKTAALISRIVDVAFEYGVKVYSIDTRSWKSQIVGSSKAKKDQSGKRDAKGDTVKYIQSLGFNLYVRTDRNGKDLYDDDAADSACMALYGFLPQSKQKLKEEN